MWQLTFVDYKDYENIPDILDKLKKKLQKKSKLKKGFSQIKLINFVSLIVYPNYFMIYVNIYGWTAYLQNYTSYLNCQHNISKCKGNAIICIFVEIQFRKWNIKVQLTIESFRCQHS